MSTRRVAVLGDPARTHGHLPDAVAAGTAASKHFDNDTDTWTVTTADGDTVTARVLVDTSPDTNDTVAGHGVANYFRIPGPHTGRQAKYAAGCIDALGRSGSTRIEARSRVRVHRRLPTRGLSRFYLSGSVADDDERYDGPAVLTHAGHDYRVRVRLAGHLDPIDGQYHWQGTLYADLPGGRVTGSRVDLRIDDHTASARISEQTPWGTLSVVGAAGDPPFELEDVELSLPPRR